MLYCCDMKKLSADTTADPVTRKSVALPASVWSAISDFRFGKRLTTEAAAIRQLILAGLAAQEIHAPADPAVTAAPKTRKKPESGA